MNSSFCNIVKLPSTGSNVTIDRSTVQPEYPRVCHFCRDTYNSELTFLRHKENGKCFRFCRLREEYNVKSRKSKTILYPRNCERCGKTFKNKTSFFRHRRRNPNCERVMQRVQPSVLGDETSMETEYVDVIELSNDDVATFSIENNVNNEENINDFDSNFIIALDVDNNYKNFNSLYPRICEFCHKLFKCDESFQRHRTTKRCRAERGELTFPRKCPNCEKTISTSQLYVKHRSRCESYRKKILMARKRTTSATNGEGFVAFSRKSNFRNIRTRCQTADANASSLSIDAAATSDKPPSSNILRSSLSMSDEMSYSLNQIYYDLENCNFVDATDNAAPSPKPRSEHKSLYPRTCEFCGFVFRSKFPFHRHKKKCPGYTSSGKSGLDALYPRRCICCSQIFVSHQTFQLHRKYSRVANSIQAAPVSAMASTFSFASNSVNDTDCSLPTNNDDDTVKSVVSISRSGDSKPASRQIIKYGARVTYPRICTKCGQTYAGKQSFCNHKKYCKKFRKANEALYEEYGSDKDSDERDQDEALLYPRTCKFCLKTYVRKQSFYQHKRICAGYLSSTKTISKDAVRKSMYPRVCLLCRKTYSSKQTFYVHAKLCPINSDAAIETLAATEPVLFDINTKEGDRVEDEQEQQQNEDDNDDGNDNNDCSESEITTSKEHMVVIDVKAPISFRKNTYPKICELCRRIYACRQTFSRHKKKCVASRYIGINGGLNVGVGVQKETYPKECEYCGGTFKCASTFHNHKVRCDFFETNVPESKVTVLQRTSCERCRHILTQSRRMLHRHLKECHDPFVNDACGGSSRDMMIGDAKSEDEERETTAEIVQDADAAIAASTGGICECCGILFDTADLLQQHVHADDFDYDTANEKSVKYPWQYDVKAPLTLISLANPQIKTYPRFCECCGKIYKTKQTFYNHKKNCHIHCFKYFIGKECENCGVPFKCEKLFAKHIKTCLQLIPKIDKLVDVASEMPSDLDHVT